MERSKLLQPELDSEKTGYDGNTNDDYYSYSAEKHPWMFPRPLSELENNAVPNHVFFVWCTNRTFTFSDYLSVLSAWKFMEPDKLEVHRGAEVQTDKYNQWFLELNRTIPAFTAKLVKRTRSICLNPLYYALEVLSDRGGVYMDFSTVLLQPLHFLRKENFSVGVSERGGVAFVASGIKDRRLQRVLTMADVDVVRTTTHLKKMAVRKPEKCPSLSSTLPVAVVRRRRREEEGQLVCVTTPASLELNPLDLLGHAPAQGDAAASTATTLRDLFYADLDGSGFSSSRSSSRSSSSRSSRTMKNTKKKKGGEWEGKGGEEGATIPFIVHYVWFGSSELSFRMYLSFLSTVHVAGAERVFVHTDLYLRGPYWSAVRAHRRTTVVYREPPREIFGRQVLYTQHRSDVVRADVLDKYGGVYVDWDVLWLRSPRPLLAGGGGGSRGGRGAVVSLDHMPRPPFRDVLNLGVFLAEPRSRFVRLWRWELRNYRSRDFFYNALELPYKVLERNPHTVLVDDRLQVSWEVWEGGVWGGGGWGRERGGVARGRVRGWLVWWVAWLVRGWFACG